VSTELERRLERIDGLVERLETGADPVLSATARELVQILMELHGAALGQMLTLARQTGPAGQSLVDQFAHDPLIRSVLLLYDLHPVDPETRVREALDHTRPYLDSHGGAAEFVQFDDQGAVHLRVQGAASLTTVVENAVREAAPDLEAVVVERQEPLVHLARRR
jgi:Fe-S cluster biogenesis protein NfuA